MKTDSFPAMIRAFLSKLEKSDLESILFNSRYSNLAVYASGVPTEFY